MKSMVSEFIVTYTLLTAYVADRQKSKKFSLDQNVGRPISSEDRFTFSRTIKSKIYGKQRARAVHTS
jgi:hypothetical protein